MVGAEIDELVGRSFRVLVDRSDLRAIEPQIRRIGTGERITFETPYHSREGRRRWALVDA